MIAKLEWTRSNAQQNRTVSYKTALYSEGILEILCVCLNLKRIITYSSIVKMHCIAQHTNVLAHGILY